MSFLVSEKNNTIPLSLSSCLKEGKFTALCTINTERRKGIGQDNPRKVKLNKYVSAYVCNSKS